VSYDLFFNPKSGELSRDALLDHFAERPHYGFADEDEEVIAYDNDVTGVYFHFRFDEGGGGSGEEEAEGDDDGPEISFEINAFRPPTFALEAEIELSALVKKFDLKVFDPQEDGIAGEEWKPRDFLRGWTKLNELAYAKILNEEWDPEEPVYTLPRAEIERCWKWNVRYEELVEELGEHYFIANIALAATKDDKVSIQAMWPDARPVLLPKVDAVLLVRGEGKKQETRLVPWDELAARIPALREAPKDDPSEHWSVTSLEIADRLDAFFGKDTKNARVTLIPNDRVHAAEDVEKARGKKKKR
jgi:hypothetical protein